MKERQALESAVEGLYEAFAAYPLRDRIVACEHCVSNSDQARIRSKPLRELTGEDLDKYSSDALCVWGDEDDFRHFLPRLLELIAFTPSRVYPETVIGGLEYAGWSRWPAEERAALHAYLAALWPFVLTCTPSWEAEEWTAERCLCSLAQVIDDLRPFLDYWRRTSSNAANAHLALLLHDNALALMDEYSVLNDPWWSKRSIQMRQLVDWLLDTANDDFLKEAIRQHADWFENSCSGANRLVDWLNGRGIKDACSQTHPNADNGT